jgi:hypothetical protein
MIEFHETPMTPGFDGNYGWVSIAEYDAIFGRPGNRFIDDGFVQRNEVTASDGTIFVLLEKLKAIAPCP